MRFFVAMFSHEPSTPSTIRTDRAQFEAPGPRSPWTACDVVVAKNAGVPLPLIEV